MTLYLLQPLTAHSQQISPPTQTYPKVQLNDTEVREIKSKLNGESYRIYTKFPRGYSVSKKSYPVLYVLDAETNFGGVSYIVQRLIKDRIIPEILVVGVAYEVDYKTFYALRSRDLAPTSDPSCAKRKYCGGGAEAFRNFLEQELFPFVDSNYRAEDDSRALYGHSLGGLFGFFTLLNAPQMFDRYLLLSPSLWWNDKVLIRQAKGAAPTSRPAKLYVGIGEHESSRHHTGQSMIDHQLEMVRILEGKDPNHFEIRSEVLDDETHRTIFGHAFTKGLRFIYGEAE